jgi:hypothetical protein
MIQAWPKYLVAVSQDPPAVPRPQLTGLYLFALYQQSTLLASHGAPRRIGGKTAMSEHFDSHSSDTASVFVPPLPDATTTDTVAHNRTGVESFPVYRP